MHIHTYAYMCIDMHTYIYIYIHTRETDVRPMWAQRKTNVTPMWDQSEINVRAMWQPWKNNVRPMWDQCEINARPMRDQCETNVGPMKDQCETNVIPMWDLCETYVTQWLPRRPSVFRSLSTQVYPHTHTHTCINIYVYLPFSCIGREKGGMPCDISLSQCMHCAHASGTSQHFSGMRACRQSIRYIHTYIHTWMPSYHPANRKAIHPAYHRYFFSRYSPDLLCTRFGVSSFSLASFSIFRFIQTWPIKFWCTSFSSVCSKRFGRLYPDHTEVIMPWPCYAKPQPAFHRPNPNPLPLSLPGSLPFLPCTSIYTYIRHRAPRHDAECPKASECVCCMLFIDAHCSLRIVYCLCLCELFIVIRVHPPRPAALIVTHFFSHDFLIHKSKNKDAENFWLPLVDQFWWKIKNPFVLF